MDVPKVKVTIQRERGEVSLPQVTKLPCGSAFRFRGEIHIKVRRPEEARSRQGSFALNVKSADIIHLEADTRVLPCFSELVVTPYSDTEIRESGL